jgi:hypothetical protein
MSTTILTFTGGSIHPEETARRTRRIAATESTLTGIFRPDSVSVRQIRVTGKIAKNRLSY